MRCRRQDRTDWSSIRARVVYCAARDAGVLFAIDAVSGRALGDVPLSGTPDVIFLNPQSGHLYAAIGDPGVIDVIDIGTMRGREVVPTESRRTYLGLRPERETSPRVPAFNHIVPRYLSIQLDAVSARTDGGPGSPTD